MPDAVLTTLFTHLAEILTATGVIVTSVLSFLNRQKLATTNDRLTMQDQKADTLIETTGRIKHLVNSTTDEMKATIVQLRADAVIATDQIAKLTQIIDTANANIERLTQAALNDRLGQKPPAP